jgi:hypothetical protein
VGQQQHCDDARGSSQTAQGEVEIRWTYPVEIDRVEIEYTAN